MWTNKKYKGEFKSSYVFAKGDRVFQLTKGKMQKTFESWQAARKDGWTKLAKNK